MDFSHVQGWIDAFSYPAVFALLVAAGFGMPVSEDAVMLAAGMVTAHAKGNLPAMIAVAWAGVVLGDSMLWRIGRQFGPGAARLRFVRRILTPRRVAWAQRHFDRHGALTVFVARFLIGLRAVTFLTAGTSGLPYRRFIVADALAAALFVPALVWLGWRFGEAVLQDVRSALTWLVGAVVVVVLVVAAVTSIARRRATGGRTRLRLDRESERPA